MSDFEVEVTTRVKGLQSPGRSGGGTRRKDNWVVVDVHTLKMQSDNESIYLTDDETIYEEDEDVFLQSETPDQAVNTPLISSPISIPSLSPTHSTQSAPSPSHIRIPPQCRTYSAPVQRASPVHTIANWDIGSPLSSGYGSAPHGLLTTSTQTPPTSPSFYIRTHVTIRMNNASGFGYMARRRLLAQERRGRYRSEGDAPMEEDALPLPDVVTFRERANSAPTRSSRMIAVGRELRRISDEIQMSFETLQRLDVAAGEQNIFMRVFNSFRRRRPPSVPEHDDSC
ncbi:uncharacterized protein [Antedon mediterranea]|uniref:uncharacterized protein n=1 Tax=Antedon mediterranea TaxID=105859 RepID=UPI003AF8149B